jgi:hypothetical protein
MEAHADPEALAVGPARRQALAQFPLEAEGCEAGPAGVILVGDRGPEQGHEAVPKELVDRARVPVDLG